jgi:hypothetical protein
MSASLEKPRYEPSDTAVPDWAGVAAGAWEAPSWKAAAREYHAAREHAGGRPPQPSGLQPKHGSGRAASMMVEALMFELRDGIHVLPTKRGGLRRLSELSADQLKGVCARLQNFKPTIARPWTADEVAALVRIWGKSHE